MSKGERGALVVDNGTYKCKTGTADAGPAYVFRNYVYRVKEKSGAPRYILGDVDKKKLEGLQASTVTQKSMFDGPIIYNYELLESTLDGIMVQNRADMSNGLIITECFMNPGMYKKQILAVLFEIYECPVVQFGYDFVYSYEHNLGLSEQEGKGRMCTDTACFGGEKVCDVILSMGHSGVLVVPVGIAEGAAGGKKRIFYEQSMFLDFGGGVASSVFHESINIKYHNTGLKISREDSDRLFEKMWVSADYFKESEEMAHTGKGNVQVGASAAAKPAEPRADKANPPKARKVKRKEAKRQKRAQVAEGDSESPCEGLSEEQIEEAVEGAIEDAAEAERPPEPSGAGARGAKDEDLRRMRRERLVRGAMEHRSKQKIAKSLERMRAHIAALEEALLKNSDMGGFLKKKRERLEALERELRMRKNVRADLKNKKSKYSLLLLKRSLGAEEAGVSLSPEEEQLLGEIEACKQEDLALEQEIECVEGVLRECDASYKPREENVVDKMRNGYGKARGGINVNIELIRTPEVLFNPHIVGIEQPGIVEGVNCIIRQGYAIRNVFITGGFSQIEGLAERLEAELRSLSYHEGFPRICRARDCVYDAFRGCSFKSRFFQAYKREDYLREGAAALIERNEYYN